MNPNMTKYRPISTALSPNTERDDIVLAKKLLLNPKHLVKGSAVHRLEEKIKELLPIKYAYTFRSGRSALYTALQVLNLKDGDEVITQSYTCAAVPNAILWTGASPVYADIDKDTFNISIEDLAQKITSKTKAIIVQHTFGYPADLRRVQLLAKKRGITIIEDCAHSLGATYDGKNVGTYGDMAIFSFGRDKVISGVVGGMLVTNHFFYSKKIESIRSKLKLPSALWVVKQLLHPLLLNHVILPTYDMASLGKAILESLKTVGIFPKAIYKAEKTGGKAAELLGLMPNAMAVLALHQLRKLHKFNTHRAHLAKFYEESLKPLGKLVKLPKTPRNGTHIFLRYTILTPNAASIVRRGRKENLILGDWYRPTIAPEGVNFDAMRYNPSSCPNAEEASIESINLPTHINIKHHDAEKIVHFLKRQLKKY